MGWILGSTGKQVISFPRAHKWGLRWGPGEKAKNWGPRAVRLRVW